MEKNGTFDLLPKKELIGIRKEYDKLIKSLGGIREMKKLPSALIIVDPKTEETAIKEARKLNIPVFGIVDTNCDPDMVDYVIPANDDAVRSVKLVIGVLANAIAEVNNLEMINYVSEDDKLDTKKERMEKAVEEVKELAKEELEETKEELKEKVEEVKKEVTEKVTKAKEEVKEKAPKVAKEVKKAAKEVKETVKKAAKEIKKTVKEDYSSMTLAELKAVAKEKKISGYSTMKKAELIDALK